MPSKFTRIIVAIVACASLGACATNHYGQYSRNPDCHNGTNYGTAILGAAVGGLVGSQIGRGFGNSVAVAAGVGAGAAIGNDAGCR